MVRRVIAAWLLVGLAVAGGIEARPSESELPFGSDLDAGRREATRSGRPLAVLFGAAWCPACRQMREATLRAPEILAFADDYVWVWVDIDRSLETARRFEVDVTPTTILYDRQLEPRQRIVGGPPVGDLKRMLTEVRDGAAESGEVDDRTFDGAPLTWSPDGYRGRSICFSHVGYGPLKIPSQSPFQSLRLALVPRTPSTLGRGQWEVAVGATWANVWANDDARFDPANGEYGRYLLDYETLHGSLAAAWGVSDTLQVELEYDERWRFGGVMDGFVQGFHDLFGIDQSGRDRVPRDAFRVLLDFPGQPRAELGDGDRGAFVRNVTATAQHNVTCGTAALPALAWAATVRYAALSEDLSGGEVDLALSVSASRRFDSFYGYLTFGHAWYGSDAAGGIPLADSQLTALAALEWRYAPRASLLLQWLASEAVVDDLGPFSESSHEVTLGWKGELSAGGVLEIGLIENLLTFDNSPDFGVHAGWTQRF